MSWLLPIDAHAHIKPGIPHLELRALRAFVCAVTREPAEWQAASARQDRDCVWGLGCHPKLARAFDSFDADRLHHLSEHLALIGEVGLDGRSAVSKTRQVEVFRKVLEIASERPRLVTIHSVDASADVLAELERRPIEGAILHWWRGTPEQTARAVELGCYFSLNGAEANRPKVLSLLPSARVLTETDFPHSSRSDPNAERPGAVETIELALAAEWACSQQEVRERVWKNLDELCRTTATSGLLPRNARAALLSLPRTS
jgi:TatD DNase family protein